jgi:protein-S-isoprenylcysteine O-methyltransferase Ste14
MPILNVIVALLLAAIIKPRRMSAPELSTLMKIVGMVNLGVLCVLLWFVPFRINLAFWVGMGVVVIGHVINGLACGAMREHQEKRKAVVDWGIYGIVRHPHFLHGVVTSLGVIIMGWRLSTIYAILWIYFGLSLIYTWSAVLMEETRTAEKLGQDYEDYMRRVPRHFLIT